LARYDTVFCENLVKVLKGQSVDPGRPDISLHFKFLIRAPLTESHDHFASHNIPVIVIDALDECDYDGSQTAQRKAFLDTLTNWSSLSKLFKLVITGRDERMSDNLRAICQRITLPTGEAVTTHVNQDIRHFFENRCAELGGSSCTDWPGHQVLDALTAKAAGLFIWAETVMKFMEQGPPDEQLKLVLAGDVRGVDNITNLYKQILEFSFPAVQSETLELFKLVVSTIVLAKVPLRSDDLHQFVLKPKVSVAFILRKLSSVISVEGTEKWLRIGHLSFTEFLCDHRRCPQEFYIDQERESQDLVMACFRLMKGLKFNICDLETSCLFNDQVENLSQRIEANIPNALWYSCHFWAAHLLDISTDLDGQSALRKEIRDFLYIRLLWWLEVMSLKKEVAAANIAVLAVLNWMQVSGCSVAT
jgi:hypothetical protein